MTDHTELTEAEERWLKRLEWNHGRWPDRPFLASPDGARLMRLGLVEVIKPEAPWLPYVALTEAGWQRVGDSERAPLHPALGDPPHPVEPGGESAGPAEPGAA